MPLPNETTNNWISSTAVIDSPCVDNKNDIVRRQQMIAQDMKGDHMQVFFFLQIFQSWVVEF